MELYDQARPDLGVRIAIPSTWSEADADHADVVYLAEEQDGYRTSVALAGDHMDPPTPDRFEEIIGAVPDALRDRHSDVEVVRDLRFAQEGMPAWLVRYRWHDEANDQTFEQVMAFIVVDPESGAVLQVDASTIAPLADEHLPVIQAILSSIRPLSD